MADPVDVSNSLKKDEVEALYKYIRKYEVVTLTKYVPLFDVSGAATWGDVISLWSKTLDFYSNASAITLSQTSSDLEVNWGLATGVVKTGIRDDLIALGIAVAALLTLLEANDSLISITLDRISGTSVYSNLTSGQRAVVKASLDDIAALIVS